MNVLILNPPAYRGVKFIREGRCEQRLSSFQYVMVPISLPSIAALLRAKGHSVKIIDSTVEDTSVQKMLEDTKKIDPQLIIFNTATATFYGDVEFIKAVKEISKSHLSAIGAHVSSLPEQVLRESPLDSVIRSEPEYTAYELAQALEAGEDLTKVEGVSVKINNKIIHNAKRPFIKNLDDLPFPARDLIKNERYVMPFSNKPYTLLVSSRGCTHNCIYCTARQYYGNKLRLRSPENVVDEVEEIVNKYGINDITMWSDTFTLDRDFVVSVSDEILKRGLKLNWMANSRVDRVDYELMKIMKKSGCSMLSFGVESGAQNILNNVKKGATLEQAEQAFEAAREAGIETIAHFMLGLPGETKETVKQTIRFAKKIRPDYAQFYCAIPFPGTEFHDIAQKNGWIVTNNWSSYEINQPIISLPGLSNAELKKAKKRAFMSFYFRPTYVLKTLARAKSLKEALNIIKQGLSFLNNWALSSDSDKDNISEEMRLSSGEKNSA